jgi:energy-coupling factor transport system permease protein
MLFCFSLSSCAFFITTHLLSPLILVNAVLLIHGYFLGGKFKGLLLLFITQLAITVSLYLLLHGVERVSEGVIAVVRILLAIVPGWWLAITCASHRIGEVLSWFLPYKWAFVMAASFSLLPHISRELKDIYQMQVMRGARITAKDLCRPTNWGELIYCVLYPLLILLLKLSKQMALAAQLRRFGQHRKPTHWPD